jgi:Rod binding domain-containing protein
VTLRGPLPVDGVRAPASQGGAPPEGARAQEAAAAVEGIVASMLVSEMKKTLHGGGFFGDGPGAGVFDGMFERLMGEEIARHGGFGLAEFVARELTARGGGLQDAPPRTDLERTGQKPGIAP